MAYAQLVYPSAAELYSIAPDLVNEDIKNNSLLGWSLMPMKNVATFEVRYDQKDNSYGMMGMRGLEGHPRYIKRTGRNQYSIKPGVYGNVTEVTETEIMTAADPLNPTMRLDMSQHVLDCQALLSHQMAVRGEYNCWTLFLTGTLSIPLGGPTNPAGSYDVTFPIQTYSNPISWANTSTAVPIQNMQTYQQLWVGHGVSFGPEADLIIQQVTANAMLNNTNSNDFGGRRTAFGSTINNVVEADMYFRGQGLPGIKIYDKGFQTVPVSGPITLPGSQYQKYIPPFEGVLMGKRLNGDPVGHTVISVCSQNIALARETGNAGMALGMYSIIRDTFSGSNAPKKTPGTLECEMGFNGCQLIEYPQSMAAITM